jgi:NAD+ diphosphatase
MNPHVFAGNPLDRGDVYRRDQQWLDAQAHNARSRFLPLWQLNVLIQATQETRLGWVSPADMVRLDIAVPPVFLGLQDDIAHFAVDVSQLGDPQHELNLDESWRFEDARTAATLLSGAEAGMLAQSRAQLDWHRLASTPPVLQRVRTAH